MYSPVPFAVRHDLSQPAGGPRQVRKVGVKTGDTTQEIIQENNPETPSSLSPLLLPFVLGPLVFQLLIPHLVPASALPRLFVPRLRRHCSGAYPPFPLQWSVGSLGLAGCTRSSARRPRILERFFPFPVTLLASAHSVFRCGSHYSHSLNRWFRVCILYGQTLPACRRARVLRPFRQCPVLS